VVKLYEHIAAAGGAFKPAPVVAIALNGAGKSDLEVKTEIDRISALTGLPCTDAVRFGGDILLDAVLS
jgi:uncharacterized NAD-dependent epimerase/dehydratase family protein